MNHKRLSSPVLSENASYCTDVPLFILSQKWRYTTTFIEILPNFFVAIHTEVCQIDRFWTPQVSESVAQFMIEHADARIDGSVVVDTCN